MSRDCESLCTPYRAVLLCIWLLVALNACGFRQAPPKTVVVDVAFERYTRTASVTFAQGEYARPADLYRQALERAYARDDRGAIVDTQYNLAVVLLRSGLLEEARAAVDAAKVELTWGGKRFWHICCCWKQPSYTALGRRQLPGASASKSSPVLPRRSPRSSPERTFCAV